MNGTFNILKVCNGDLEIRFSCANYGRRIKEAINNLGILHDDESKEQWFLLFATIEMYIR